MPDKVDSSSELSFKQKCLTYLSPLQLAQIRWLKQYALCFEIGMATPLKAEGEDAKPYPLLAICRMDPGLNTWSRLILFKDGYHTIIKREADNLAELLSPCELNGHAVQWWIYISQELLDFTPELEARADEAEAQLTMWSLAITPKLNEVFSPLEKSAL